MPHLRINGTRVFYEDTGGQDRPTLLFSHGLLWDTRLYEPQIAHFAEHYRCIAYDHRGQGRSQMDMRRSIDMETLYQDTVGLIEALSPHRPCHMIGLSMGGFVAMRVAARRPELVQSLSLLATQAGPESPEKIKKYQVLNVMARAGAMRTVSSLVMKIMFGEAFLRDNSRRPERQIYQRRLQSLPRQIYRAVNGVIDREAIDRELPRITCPTLVLHGTQDAAISMEKSRTVAALIPDARHREIPDAGHTMTLEAPHRVNQALEEFLSSMA
jgi:pimeloyl-ACP methyl ester carboxylesterase